MIFFTADQHFFHENIIKSCNRPFRDVQEMNRTIITNFNSVVQPKDEVWHLGDFMWLNNKHSIGRLWTTLKGHHHFIAGNHDKWLKTYKNQNLFIPNLTIHEPLKELKYHKQGITLCHYAMIAWRGSYRGVWQLFGHSHGKLEVDSHRLQIDVGVDCHGFYPVSFDQVKIIMDEKAQNHRTLSSKVIR